MERELSRERISKDLFGKKYRLDIWERILEYAIEPPELFRQSELQDKLESEKGVTKASTSQEAIAMCQMGMLEEVPSPYHHPSVYAIYYKRVESPYWDIAQAVIEAVQKIQPAADAEEIK